MGIPVKRCAFAAPHKSYFNRHESHVKENYCTAALQIVEENQKLGKASFLLRVFPGGRRKFLP